MNQSASITLLINNYEEREMKQMYSCDNLTTNQLVERLRECGKAATNPDGVVTIYSKALQVIMKLDERGDELENIVNDCVPKAYHRMVVSEASVVPKFTEWTDDKTTWPEDSQEVIVHCGKIKSRDFATFNKPLKRFDLDAEGYITINEKECLGPVEWRPLCDHDSPPR